MRGDRVAGLLVAGLLALALGSSAARAEYVYYSWSGLVKQAPEATENPWLLAAEGTPFVVQALVDAEAVDRDGTQNPDYADFEPALVILEIGEEPATVLSAKVLFSDDAFDGLFDSIIFHIQATRLDTTLFFFAGTRVAASTFELASPAAPDLPPVFADTLPVQFGGAGTGTITTFPSDGPVTGRAETCPGPPPVSWTSPTTGTSGEIEIELLDMASTLDTDLGFQDAAFAAGPLCSTAKGIAYDTGADWTVTLSPPADSLLLYARAWRGSFAGVDPSVYQFDRPFTILSGLAEATVSDGDTRLTLPNTAFHDGILRFAGPIESLSVVSSSTTASAQVMTLAVPEPDAGGAAALAFGVFAGWRRRARVTPGGSG